MTRVSVESTTGQSAIQESAKEINRIMTRVMRGNGQSEKVHAGARRRITVQNRKGTIGGDSGAREGNRNRRHQAGTSRPGETRVEK
jgi:hypothetical protein